MKKLLSFILAGATLFGTLGFVSCSGDLHDSEVTPLFLEGDLCGEKVENRLVFTKDSETEQHLDFVYNANMKAWGGGNGKANFKIVRDASGWAQDWGWKKDISNTLTINDEDYLELKARDASNDNPGNLVLKDLEEDQVYRINVKYDAPSKVVKILVTGNVTDYPALRVIIGDKAFGMKRDGSTYTYKFTAEKTETVKYFISNGYTYWGKDGKAKYEKVADNAVCEVAVEKDTTYEITAIATDLPDLSISAVKAGSTVTILTNADIIGGMDGWKGSALTYVDDTTYTYEFTNSGSEFEFDIRELKGSWDVGRWFAGIKAENIDVAGGSDRQPTARFAENIVAAKNGETPKAVTPVYYKGDSGSDGSNLKVTGMPAVPGHKFLMTIKIVNAKQKEISITVEPAETIPAEDYEAPINLDGFGVRGLFGEWSAITDAIKLVKQNNGTYTCEFTATATESDAKIADGAWSPSYPADHSIKDSATPAEFKADGTEVTVDNRDTGISNSKITGMTIGTTYIMTIKPKKDTLIVSVAPKA